MGAPPPPMSALSWRSTRPCTVTGKSMLKPPLTVPVSRCAEYCSGNPECTPPLLVSTSSPSPFQPGPSRSTSTPPLLVRPLTSPARLVELDAAVDGLEFDLSVDVANRDAAVGRLERQHRHRGHRQAVADRPPFAPSEPDRAVGRHLARRGGDLDGVGNLLGARLRFCLRRPLWPCTWMSPCGLTLDLDAAVRLGVDAHGSGRHDRELADFAYCFRGRCCRPARCGTSRRRWSAAVPRRDGLLPQAPARKKTGSARFIMVNSSSGSLDGIAGRRVG